MMTRKLFNNCFTETWIGLVKKLMIFCRKRTLRLVLELDIPSQDKLAGTKHFLFEMFYIIRLKGGEKTANYCSHFFYRNTKIFQLKKVQQTYLFNCAFV